MDDMCGHALVRVAVELSGRSMVLNRCGPCDTTWWTEDGRPARRGDVYAALRGDARRILRSRRVVDRLARRRSTALEPTPKP
jgi:nicotinate-nucleotide pyrophosphorylase